MKMISKIGVACVLLACMAPAMAVDFYEIADSEGGVFLPATYNPNPDVFDLIDWENAYTPPYATYMASPYYEYGAATSGWHPTTADNVRFGRSSADKYIVDQPFSANVFHIGDDYWPLNYSYSNNTYQRHWVYQIGQDVTINEYNMGRVAAESSWTHSMANSNRWRVQNGTLNIGTLRQLNTNQDDTAPSTRAAWERHTVGGIVNMGAQNANTSVTIGDIYLNDTWTHLGMGGGTWTITGDIKEQGNLMVLMLGWRGAPGATPDLSMGADLYIKESTLLDMIDNGQFFTRYGNWNNYFAPGQHFLLPDPVGTDSTPLHVIAERGIRQITRENMYSEMVITDLGNGMVMVQVPEPASLALLALGGLALVRRRRA